jgi:hypothetical protein
VGGRCAEPALAEVELEVRAGRDDQQHDDRVGQPAEGSTPSAGSPALVRTGTRVGGVALVTHARFRPF